MSSGFLAAFMNRPMMSRQEREDAAVARVASRLLGQGKALTYGEAMRLARKELKADKVFTPRKD